jgi:hypothetical protein
MLGAGCRQEAGVRRISAIAVDSTARVDKSERPAPPTEVMPAGIVVLEPTAGDVWREGRRYTIRWSGRTPRRVHVSAAVGGKDKGHLALDYDASLDSLSWTVPVGFVTGFGPEGSDEVRLRLEDASDPRRFVESGRFSIVGTPAR